MSDREQKLLSLLESHPTNPNLHYELGCLLEKKGDLKGAEESFDECIILEPTNHVFYIKLGIISLKKYNWATDQNKVAEYAMSHGQSILPGKGVIPETTTWKSYPQHAERVVPYSIGVFAPDVKNYIFSIFEKAVELEPKIAQYHYFCGLLNEFLFAASGQSYPKSKQYYSTALDLDSTNHEYNVAFARILIKVPHHHIPRDDIVQYVDTELTLRRLNQIDPNNPYYYYCIGVLMLLYSTTHPHTHKDLDIIRGEKKLPITESFLNTQSRMEAFIIGAIKEFQEAHTLNQDEPVYIYAYASCMGYFRGNYTSDAHDLMVRWRRMMEELHGWSRQTVKYTGHGMYREHSDWEQRVNQIINGLPPPPEPSEASYLILPNPEILLPFVPI